MRGLIELIVTVAVAVAIAFLVQAFLIKPYRIPSPSMVPTRQIGQRILVNRLDTHPKLGSVVVFHPPRGANPQPAVCGVNTEGSGRGEMCDRGTPQESSQTFVKRLVGLPGDRLSLRNGVLYRNGHPERVHNALPCGGQPSACDFPHTITVPRGCLGQVFGKSTYSRLGVLVNCTPLEPEWTGRVTMTLANVGRLPVRLHLGEGIAQVVFQVGDEVCRTSYADRKGRYQNATGPQLSKPPGA